MVTCTCMAAMICTVQAWLHLRRYHDLEVTLYVLAPQFSSLRERERRRDMLAERTHMMLAGLEEEDLPEGMSLDEIRRPSSEEPPPLEERVVWAVPHALALRRSVAEVVEACELLALTETTAPHARPPGAADGWQLREQMTWEMGVAGLHGAGTMFEGLGAPRSAAMDFEAFAFHAQVRHRNSCFWEHVLRSPWSCWVGLHAVSGRVGAQPRLRIFWMAAPWFVVVLDDVDTSGC